MTLLLLVGLAWYVLFVGTPDVIRSMYRYRLWALRDEFVDAVIAGELPSDRRSREVLEILENSIRSARSFTIVKVLLSFWFARRAGFVEAAEQELASRPPHPADEYEERLMNISRRYLLLTSPSGWLAPIWLPIGWAVYRLVNWRRPIILAKRPRDLVEKPVRTEAEIPTLVSGLIPDRHRHDDRALASCVG
jgi:hypothetical protein